MAFTRTVSKAPRIWMRTCVIPNGSWALTRAVRPKPAWMVWPLMMSRISTSGPPSTRFTVSDDWLPALSAAMTTI
jgi:hypothetical protein